MDLWYRVVSVEARGRRHRWRKEDEYRLLLDHICEYRADMCACATTHHESASLNIYLPIRKYAQSSGFIHGRLVDDGHKLGEAEEGEPSTIHPR